jgi:TM2 domain-containing membrane protein YozV
MDHPLTGGGRTMPGERTTKFCENCGAEIDWKAEICSRCGVRVQSPAEIRNPGVSLILSFFIPGLGQLYNGQITKGLIFIAIGFFLALTVILLIGIMLYPLFWIYNMYDAYDTAKKVNAGIIKPD